MADPRISQGTPTDPKMPNSGPGSKPVGLPKPQSK